MDILPCCLFGLFKEVVFVKNPEPAPRTTAPLVTQYEQDSSRVYTNFAIVETRAGLF